MPRKTHASSRHSAQYTQHLNTANTQRCQPCVCYAAHLAFFQGFWPALQVLYGDTESAAHTLELFFTLVHRFGVPPELFNLASGQLVRPGYPLRPELAESLYYLSQATDDVQWLRYGRDMDKAIQNITRVVRAPYGQSLVFTHTHTHTHRTRTCTRTHAHAHVHARTTSTKLPRSNVASQA